MKKLFLIVALSIIYLQTFGQKKIVVEEKNESIGNGNNSALVVTFFEATVSDVEKAWKSEMKKAKAKVSMKKEIFADNAAISSISTNTMDIYAKIKAFGDDAIQMVVAFDLGGAFLSSSQHPSQFKAAKQMLYDFAVKETKRAIAGQLKIAKKTLSKLEKEHEKLIKENDNLHQNIDNWHSAIEKYKNQIEQAKQNIEQAKQDIETNAKDQEKAKTEVGAQKTVVEKTIEKENSVK